MSCCCHERDLIGGLMGDLTGKPVHKGARFSLGVEINNYILFQDDLELMMTALGQSQYVGPQIKVSQLAGVINPFIMIEGTSGREYGSDHHLEDAILSVIQGQGYSLNLETVRFEVQTYDPETGQTGTTRRDTPAGGSASNAPPPGAKTSFWDDIAKELEISKSEAQLMIIGGGALLLVLLARR